MLGNHTLSRFMAGNHPVIIIDRARLAQDFMMITGMITGVI